MKTISKKLFSLLLVVIMVASVIPFQAFAVLKADDQCPLENCYGHLFKVAAETYTCEKAGHSEYFQCNKCNSKFNANGGTDITVTPAQHTKGQIVPADPGDCQTVGKKEHYRCTKCGAYEVNGTWTKDESILLTTLGNHVNGGDTCPEKKADCTDAGNKEYTKCDKCNAIYVDGAWTTDTSMVVEPVNSSVHVAGTHFDEVPATCTENGTKGYTLCTKCGARKVDGETAYTKNSAKWIILATGTDHVAGTPVPEVPATCTEDGTKGYTPCTKCTARKVDGETAYTKNASKWTIPATGHTYSKNIEGGNDDDCYKVKCTVCKKYFACDENACVTVHTPLTDGHAPHSKVEGVCTVCGNGLPEGENVAGEYGVLVKYVNANGQVIKAEKVYPTCVIMKADDTYIDKAVMSTGFIMPGDPTSELRFKIADFFTIAHYDDEGKLMTLDMPDDETNAVKNVKRSPSENIVTIKVKYSMPEVTLKFEHGDGGKFTGVNQDKDVVAFNVKYGDPLPTPPAYEGKDAAHRAVGKWINKVTGEIYQAGGTCKLTADATMVAVYDTEAEINSTLNVVFYGSGISSVTKTMTGLNASKVLGFYLHKAGLEQIIKDYGLGFELVSEKLYKNTSGTSYDASTTVADVNKANGYVYVNVKAKKYTATFYGSDGVVDGLIGNSDYKVLEDLKYGQTKIEMPIPVATKGNHTFYGWLEKGGEVYKFEANTKLTFNYNYNRDTYFTPIWNTSAGVYVNIYFNNITNRSLYTVKISDVEDTLTVNQVLNLLSQYFTWTSYRGLYTNDEWIAAVKNNFATGSGTKSVDGVSVALDKDRNEFNLMLLGAKQNGITISKANLSTIGIGVNKDGAYAPADPSNPKTGNEAQMLGVAVASMVMAVITLGGVTYYTRKKEEMI